MLIAQDFLIEQASRTTGLFFVVLVYVVYHMPRSLRRPTVYLHTETMDAKMADTYASLCEMTDLWTVTRPELT